METIAIVTDSTADIPMDLAVQYHIYVIPNILIVNGESLKDGIDMTRHDFYERLPTMKAIPTTATASSGTYQHLYKKLLQEGVSQILSIHASSLLSGIYNAACVAAHSFEERVHVIDSQSITLGLGFQVLAAAEAALSEPIERILKIIEDVRRRVHVIAMLDTLEYVRRSGRVSWARARLGELMHIKPLLEVKGGRVLSLGLARTRRKGIERLVEFLYALGKLERLAIVHTNADKDAQELLESLSLEIATPPVYVNVTTVIGTHTGPNALGFAAVAR